MIVGLHVVLFECVCLCLCVFLVVCVLAYLYFCKCVCVCVCVCVCGDAACLKSGSAVPSYLLTPLCSGRPALFVLIPLHLQGGLH